MFNTRPQAPWVPFTIPPCPTPVGGKQYALSFSGNAVPTKNPSQFLEWQEVEANLPDGISKGDLLYWDPAAGDEGAWIVLAAPSDEGSIIYWNGDGWSFLSPPSGQGLKVLTANGGNLAWTDTQDC